MKSVILAAATAAAVVSAHEARSPLSLKVDALGIKAELCLGLDVKLPLGISLATPDDCPKDGPPSGCTNTWHPPHHVPMDGCDDNGGDEWHYVRPCGCSAEVPHQWTTSTVTQTQVSTIISCAPTVTDCPANGHSATTVIVPATTYVCPVAVTSTTLATIPTSKPYTQPVIQSVAAPAPQTRAPVYTQPVYQPAAQPAPAAAPAAAAAPQPVVIRPIPTQAPPAWTPPPPAAPAPATYYPEPTVAPIAAPAAAAAPYPEDTTPVVVVPPPVGTGYGNWSSYPITAGAAQTSQKMGAVVAMGLVAALLI